MARRRKSKKRSLPRGSRGPSRPSQIRHDLDVPLPAVARSTNGRKRVAEDRQCLVDRLHATGYGTVAFSHTVYGKPHPEKDTARSVMPWSFDGIELGGEKEEGDDCNGEVKCENKSGPLILRRLNVVIEDASDVVRYSASSDSDKDDPLNSYDLVAISARNDPAFTAACSSATRADVFVLDYTAGRGGVQLPHRIRPADIRAASERGAAFEIPYAPAILDPSKRKAMVRTALELRNACMSVRNPRPRIILSSGSRTTPDGVDAGPMALRTPGDMANVMMVVLGFGDRVAFDAAGEVAGLVVESGKARRTGRTVVASSAPGLGSVAVDVAVMTEGGRSGAQLGWAADAEAPLAGKMAEALENVAKKPRKKIARRELHKDVKGKAQTNNDGGIDVSADEKDDGIGQEDGFMAL